MERVTKGMHVWTMRSEKASLSDSVLSWHLNVKNVPAIQRRGGGEGGKIEILGSRNVNSEGYLSLFKRITHPNKSKSMTASSFNGIPNLWWHFPTRIYDCLILLFNIYELRAQTLGSYTCSLSMRPSLCAWYNDFCLVAKITLQFMIYCCEGH